VENIAVDQMKKAILEEYRNYFSWQPLEKAIEVAFLDVNRHDFVDKFRVSHEGEWMCLNADNLSSFLPIIYRDEYLIIKSTDSDDVISSISQPTLVLYMLSLSEVKRGDRVLEIGTASGWNAALLSTLVGPSGVIKTIEIDTELSVLAERRLQNLGYHNIEVLSCDGGRGTPGRKYDVVMYTVGSYDIPEAIYDQVKIGGVLVMVLKSHGGGDTLIKFRRVKNGFSSESAIPCGFVQIQGEMRTNELQPRIIVSDSDLSELWNGNREDEKFWFGGMNEEQFYWRSLPFRAYLSIVEPYYCVLTENPYGSEPGSSDVSFGIYNADEYSISVLHQERLISCGGNWAKDRIKARVHEWVDLGMPTLAAFRVEARTKRTTRRPEPNEYWVRRDETDFFFQPT